MPDNSRPSWQVTVATDDAKILTLSINDELGQLYIAHGDNGRAPEHVATLNRKTHALDNLIDSLLEARDRFEAVDPTAANDTGGDVGRAAS